jgi:hypothetical protein
MKNPAAGGSGARSTDFVHPGINGRNTTAGSIAQALGGFRNGNGFLCRCPVPSHGAGRGDRNPSLSLADGDDGKPLVHCFAGCDPRDVLATLRSRGLLDDRRANGGAKPNGSKAAIQFTFEYRDPVSGEARYRKIRREYADGTKSFFMEPKDRGGSPPLLYGGERLADLTEGQPVWIVEGEKKVEALRARGAIAVSGDTGAQSKWLPEHARLLRGRPVIFWPDSDSPGEGYIARAAAAIQAENPGADLRVVRPFPTAAEGEKGRDVCDWVGGDEDFAALIESAKPYEPEAAKNPAGGLMVLCRYFRRSPNRNHFQSPRSEPRSPARRRPLQARFRCRLPWRRSLSSPPCRWPPALMRT